MPDLDVVRLFLHWVESEHVRVDLDLSCAFFRADWSHAGHCDYTTLRFARGMPQSTPETSRPPRPPSGPRSTSI